jgi:hypothetical protein
MKILSVWLGLAIAAAVLLAVPEDSAAAREPMQVIESRGKAARQEKRARRTAQRRFRQNTLTPMARAMRQADADVRRARAATGQDLRLNLVDRSAHSVYLQGDGQLRIRARGKITTRSLVRSRGAGAAQAALIEAGYGDAIGSDAEDRAALETLSPASIEARRAAWVRQIADSPNLL